MGYVRNGIYTYKMGVEYHNFYANMHNYISVCVYIIIYIIYTVYIHITGFQLSSGFSEHSGAFRSYSGLPYLRAGPGQLFPFLE